METTQNTPSNEKTHLRRPIEGRVLGGVAAAVADHTGASVGLVRLGFLVTALLGGFGIVLYAAAWALMPAQGETESAAERWLHNLTTPGKRLGAFLVGIASLIILAGAAPATILAAATLLAAAALLANSQPATTTPTSAPTSVDTEEN
jgi:phage shock protein PspC (stress-responsive transcriptional regulator)